MEFVNWIERIKNEIKQLVSIVVLVGTYTPLSSGGLYRYDTMTMSKIWDMAGTSTIQSAIPKILK